MTKFPVINSTLSENALCDYLQQKYNLTSITTCKLFRAAMNHIYVVTYGDIRYVFRVYTHNWRTKAEITEELRLLNHLKDNHNAVAFPIPYNLNELIHEFEAPEGKRYGVLFSYAKGKKTARFSAESSLFIGQTLAHIHKSAEHFTLNRITYDTKTLLEDPMLRIKAFFNTPSDEVKFLESLSEFLKHTLTAVDDSQLRKGAVHLDVWFDNLHIGEQNEITFFDFDFCGNGFLCFDVSYFLFQLLATNPDEKEYLVKAESFLNGYTKVSPISEAERRLLPYACLSIMIYYISIQCDRFVYWTNIFVNEDHLKRMVGNLKRWIKYNDIVCSC
ncbi:phosphotransferase [Terrimonas sp.]|uniref:phosphotransferase n=1 Tax=Terrimonas sp. TaxID=1914338 RepID=UPI00197E0B76|nr:phosphotransferase [Terrimonas sp.]